MGGSTDDRRDILRAAEASTQRLADDLKRFRREPPDGRDPGGEAPAGERELQAVLDAVGRFAHGIRHAIQSEADEDK